MKLPLALMTALLLLAAGSSTTRAVNVTFGTGLNEFDIEFVEIGDAGNTADTTGAPNPAGAVGYDYSISKYEISEDMIDKATTLGSLGITHGGLGANKPATLITWYEAATFVNWLNTSSSGTAAYKFDTVGGTFALWESGDAGFDASNPYRNSLATYWLPSVDEWYKAAYYDANTGTYFDFATGSNVAPMTTSGGAAAGTAVYRDGVNPNPPGPADITNAGGLSPYGTMGQTGNVWEWQETAFDPGNDNAGENRGLRGGSWVNNASVLQASDHFGTDPSFETVGSRLGFRVAGVSVVPEPSRMLLGVAGLCGVLLRRRRRDRD